MNENGMIILFTDGSTEKNGTKDARGGIGIYFPVTNIHTSYKISKLYDVTKEKMCGLELATNQRCELFAILIGLRIVKKIIRNVNNTDKIKKIRLITDSEYSQKCIIDWYDGWKRKGWLNSKGEPVKNLELIHQCHSYWSSLIQKYGITTEIHHIKQYGLKSHDPEPNDKKSKKWFVWHGNMSADLLANSSMQIN